MVGVAILLVALGYALGTVPFGVLAARAHGVDLTTIGSGNIGATNVFRALGWKWALAVLAADVLKGFVPSVLAANVAWSFKQEWALAAGVAAVLGHTASPFLRFRGGKGVATGLGALLGSSVYVALGALAVFVVCFLVTRIVSFSSIFAVASLPFYGWGLGEPNEIVAAYGALLLFVIYKHRSNISRILNHTEARIEFRKPKPPSPEPAASKPPESAPPEEPRVLRGFVAKQRGGNPPKSTSG